MVGKIFFVIILSLLPFTGFGQLHVADSLESLVKKVPDDTTKVWLLNKITSIIRDSDKPRALRHAIEAKRLAEVLNYKRGLAYALENMGWIYYRRGDHSKALQYASEALALAESIGEMTAVAKSLNGVSAIQYEQKHYDKAIASLRRAIQVSSKINDYESMARSYNNIAFAKISLKQLDSASFYVSKGIVLSEKGHSEYLKGFAFRILGDIHYERKRYNDALHAYERVLVIAQQTKNVFLEASTLHRLAKAYDKLGNHEKAIACLEKDIALSDGAGYKDELERCYNLLASIYANHHDTAKAYEYQTKYIAMHDSLYSQRSAEQMALLQSQVDTQMKEAEIELLTKDMQLKQEEINQQRVWMYFYIGCVSLLVILAFVLFFSNKARKRINLSLQAKNKEIQLQAQQLININGTKDKLFSIISHDLRSPLASLRGLVQLVLQRELSQQEFLEVAQKLNRNLDHVNEDLENLLFWAQSQLKGLQVKPETVNLKAIFEEKVSLYAESANNKKLTIVNELDEDLLVLADKNHLSLVIRNLLGNAIKFNREGGSIKASQKEAGAYVEVSVSDSGVGMTMRDIQRLFNSETHFSNPGTSQEKGAGIGLLLVKEFVEKNGGAIWVTSELGKGSTFTFRLRREYAMVHSKIA
jgi:signal transduction histidine kinase